MRTGVGGKLSVLSVSPHYREHSEHWAQSIASVIIVDMYCKLGVCSELLYSCFKGCLSVTG